MLSLLSAKRPLHAAAGRPGFPILRVDVGRRSPEPEVKTGGNFHFCRISLQPKMTTWASQFCVVVPCYPSGSIGTGQITRPRQAVTEKEEEAKVWSWSSPNWRKNTNDRNTKKAEVDIFASSRWQHVCPPSGTKAGNPPTMAGTGTEEEAPGTADRPHLSSREAGTRLSRTLETSPIGEQYLPLDLTLPPKQLNIVVS